MRDRNRGGPTRRRVRRLRGAVVAATAVCALALGLLPTFTPTSQAATVAATITVSPTSGRVNAIVTITLNGLWVGWVNPTTGLESPCVTSWMFDGAPWTLTGSAGTGGQGLPGNTATGSIPLNATVAAHTITAVCTNPLTGGPTQRNVGGSFTVTATTWALGDSPTSMTAGTSTAVKLTSFNNAHANPSCNVTYRLDGSGPKTAGSSNAAGTPTPLTYTVPSTLSVGTHTFSVTCSTPGLNGPPGTATATFTVNPLPTTTTRATTTTSKSPTTTAKGTSTTAKGTTTTAKGATTTTGSSSSSSTGSTSVSIDTTPTTVPGEAPVTSTTYLRLTALAIAPGSQVSANGRGCDAGAPVALTIGKTPVGHTRAGANGAFHTPLAVSTLTVGRYTVVAHCGPILAAPLDIVLASQVSAATSTLAIILFALLIGALAFRRQIFPRRPPASSSAAPSDQPPEREPPS